LYICIISNTLSNKWDFDKNIFRKTQEKAQSCNAMPPLYHTFPKNAKINKRKIDLSVYLKFAKAPCLSLWERCREATERVNGTAVIRYISVITNALPSHS